MPHTQGGDSDSTTVRRQGRRRLTIATGEPTCQLRQGLGRKLGRLGVSDMPTPNDNDDNSEATNDNDSEATDNDLDASDGNSDVTDDNSDATQDATDDNSDATDNAQQRQGGSDDSDGAGGHYIN
ncbi:hypothetical protein EDB89DRAFT_1913868 [Lactarius sanguifluus]|nr:hypothetical protein EDB89DRAFT_1913868 [Lactarius sanguifluus]